MRRLGWLAAIALLGVAFPVALVLRARAANRVDGFPLDDPWIHLTYARTLHDHHAFAYFPGRPASAGSTAPLYTLLLAAGFRVTHDEKVLSYALGLVFHAAFLGVAALWARRQLGGTAWAGAFVALLALDPRIAILAVSGMETSLFLFLVALAFWARAAGRPVLPGVAVGLAVWVRPDALILAAVFAIAGLVEGVTHPGRPRRQAWLVPFGLLVAAYLAFNLATGGVLLPNTFGAKRAYYNNHYVDPWATFVHRDLPAAFLVLGWRVVTPLACLGLLLEAGRLLRRRSSALVAEAGWAVALPLAYLVLLPFAHRFSRYLVPALPAVALLALGVLKAGWARPAEPAPRWRSWGRLAAPLLLAWAVAWQAFGIPIADTNYTTLCRYHYQRHERTGRWLREHTQPDAVVAAHDVGAIAYYSERRIVDVAGLIQPDAIPHLRKPDYTRFLRELFARERVTHLAFMTNWLEVSNQEPLFTADENPEVLQVFAWIPERTVLVPELATRLNREAQLLARRGDATAAVQALRQSVQVCPESSRTWFLLGMAQQAAGDRARAARAFREALRLYPDARDAREALAALPAPGAES